MFFFRKKNGRTADLSWLGADMHAHLLPGIDDGAQDMNTSLELVRGLVEMGYKTLVATPHILWEVYPNTPQLIRPKLSALQAAALEAGIQVKLHAAAEYYIDDHLIGLLEQKAPLLTLHNNLVLVEFSMAMAPFNLQQIFFDMQVQGYQPVLAHPERYIYLARSKEVFDGLWNAGVFFQLNLLSLSGHYGRTIQDLAVYLLEEGYYHFAGTDLHNIRQLEALQKLAASDIADGLKDYPFLNKELAV